MKQQIGVILVTYNAGNFITNCLHSLRQTSPHPKHIVVIDNASGDDTLAKVKKFSPVKLIQNKKNDGFAKGVNKGITYLKSQGCEYFVILNPDTIVHQDLFSQLLKPFAQNKKIGITGPVITYLTSPKKIWFAGGSINKIFGFTRHTFMDKLLEATLISSRQTDFISGCCMMIKKDVFEKVGFFDEDYGLYFEDVAFCYKAQRFGFHSYLLNKPLVKHVVSASTGYPGSNAFSPLKAYYFGRNQLLFLKRETKGFQKLLWLCSYFTVTTPYYLARQKSKHSFFSYLQGLRDGLSL